MAADVQRDASLVRRAEPREPVDAELVVQEAAELRRPLGDACPRLVRAATVRDYFTENVSFYPGACAKAASDPTAKAICESATRAIYRYSKWPTQAITYNLGKNAIVDLREAVKQKQGTAFSAKTFHERLMRMGTIPVSYFRDSFLAG